LTDFYSDDYEPTVKENVGSSCFSTTIVLCIVVIGFIIFFWMYTFIWTYMLPSLSDHAFELFTIGVIIALLTVVYVVSNRSIEKRKIMAAS